jgi:hypothetical protein
MESKIRVNLEKRFDTRKGIYVLTYTNKPPYKIGMTNTVIGKRISSYVNCPSQHQGHYIHLLLTWNIKSELDARVVEKYIYNKLGSEKRMNSTQRALYKRTEHFDVDLSEIKSVFIDSKKYYENKYNVKIFLDEPKTKTVRVSKVKGKKNIVFEVI